MHRVLFIIIAIIEWALRRVGLDAHTQLDDSGLGPFAFERVDHGRAGREYWGLGLHVIVSDLKTARR